MQHRIDYLTIMQGFLRERILDMEQQNARQLQLKEADMAKTQRLKHEIEQWESKYRNDTPFYHAITLEKECGYPRVGRGTGGMSKPAGLDETEDSEGDSEGDSDESSFKDEGEDDEDDDESMTPKKPKVRKAGAVTGNKMNSGSGSGSSTKKAKQEAVTKLRWTPGNTEHYHIYNCPAIGCRKKVSFAKRNDPPLNGRGHVCDQEPWCKKVWGGKIYQMRSHMAKEHPMIPEVNYPPGFAKMYDKEKSGESS